MKTCRLQLTSTYPATFDIRRPVGRTSDARRLEPPSAHSCNTAAVINCGTVTSGFASNLPLGCIFVSLLDGARRAVVLKARIAHRTMQRELEMAKLSTSDTIPQHGLAVLTALAIPPVPGNGVADLLDNRVFLVGFWSWFAAQFLKIFTKRFKKGVWDAGAMLESGGMPSSHSSLCAGITTAIAIQQGFGSPLFAACLCFSVIVMYDAMGVRRHAGKQAEVLNKVIDELLDDDHPMGEVKLKEVLGHTPRQVICGGLLGLAVALFFPV